MSSTAVVFTLFVLTITGCQGPEKGAGFAKAAEKAFAEKDYETAIQIYQQLIETGNGSPEIYFKLAESHYANGSYEESQKYFDDLTVNSSLGNKAKKYMGRIYILKGEAVKALSFLEQADVSDPETMNCIGVCYDILRKPKKAQEIYTELLGRNPNDIKIKSNLGLSKLFGGELEEAIRILEPIGRSSNANDKQRHNLALAYAFSNSGEKCLEMLNGEVDQAELSRFMKQLQLMRVMQEVNEDDHG